MHTSWSVTTTNTTLLLLEKTLLGKTLDAIEPAHFLHNSLRSNVVEVGDLVELLLDELGRDHERGVAT